MGYDPIFGDNVRFVLIDGVEVSKQFILGWLVLHAIAVPGLFVIAGVLYAQLNSSAPRRWDCAHARSNRPDPLSS